MVVVNAKKSALPCFLFFFAILKWEFSHLLPSVLTEKELRMNKVINEQRFAFVRSLYHIRKNYPQMGLFQPDFIYVIFHLRKMMPSKYNRTNDDIRQAVNDWCQDPEAATAKYGHISKWNTSMVTDMKELFKNKSDFNDDISKWDVSSVTNMSSMFESTPFNGDISRWNVSSVTDMKEMFSYSPFVGDISGWDVSSVTNMSGMFMNTPFNGDISGWNVSSVTDMRAMFGETPFNGDISGWQISDSCYTQYMLFECRIQEEHKPIGGNPNHEGDY
jgi:surface protein